MDYFFYFDISALCRKHQNLKQWIECRGSAKFHTFCNTECILIFSLFMTYNLIIVIYKILLKEKYFLMN